MAKTLLGGVVGQISGSVGGMTYSRNRYGTYLRRRAHPTRSESVYAMGAKGRLGTISRAWSARTDAERAAWYTWASNNPVTDKMGQKQALAGNAAYMMINGRLFAAGAPLLTVPPVGYAPPGLAELTLVADIGAGAVSVAFTGTPLAAGCRIWVQAAVTDGGSQSYVKNKLRFIGVSEDALASPLLEIVSPEDYAGALADVLQARFGTMAVGQLLTLYLSVIDGDTGLVSTPLTVSGLVTSTGVATTLAVSLSPPGAIENGAMWSVDGGITNYESDVAVAMTPGAKTITFRAADTYVTPAPLSKTVVIHTANAASQMYTSE